MRVLTVHELLRCYARGEFPMANDRHDPTVYLIHPERRGVIPLDAFHVPRSLRKPVRQRAFEIRIDTAFGDVIRACAEPTPERPRTWLNDGLIELYTALAEAGHAHSVECWRGKDLVGGLYGVSLGSAFFGESMFSRVRDASKVALVELVGRLRAGGFELLDTQFITDHLRRFGAIEVPRAVYLQRLRQAVGRAARFPRDDQPFGLWVVEGSAAASSAGGSAHCRTQMS
jgi:leucyl/phenylalanyl-tRNA---protein transferase